MNKVLRHQEVSPTTKQQETSGGPMDELREPPSRNNDRARRLVKPKQVGVVLYDDMQQYSNHGAEP